ncbi:MAG: DUF1697 domain-containing protein [Bacteroidetes bacterium]|nr:DUF1697 domain-containing protein [Bacteroidota bacterium]
MNTYISILRGINVSGANTIKMDALKKVYEGAGFKNVQTYIQSGNVVFRAKKTELPGLEIKIAETIWNKTKFEVPVIVKELADLKEVLAHNPFLKNREADIRFLHVTFLSDWPSKENISKINGDYKPDEFVLNGKNIYLFCPDGYGRTKLNNNFFENKLKLSATTRNWKTISQLVNIAESTG